MFSFLKDLYERFFNKLAEIFMRTKLFKSWIPAIDANPEALNFKMKFYFSLAFSVYLIILLYILAWHLYFLTVTV